MTGILSSGPGQLPAADVIDLCAIIVLRRIGEPPRSPRPREDLPPRQLTPP